MASELEELFAGLKKKKKKPPSDLSEEVPTAQIEEVDDGCQSDTYEQLLTRLFGMMRKENRAIIPADEKRLVIKPPVVNRFGTKKSIFVNFEEIRKSLHRSREHLLDFFSSEFSVTCSMDENFRLILNGKFQQHQVETVLRKYIKEFVICHSCKSSDTMVRKDSRLFFLHCETCGSVSSVSKIQQGFRCVTNKRSKK